MNIMRLESANQLSVAYESNENTVLDIEQSKLVIGNNQDVLCDNVLEVVRKNKIALAQSPEERISKAVVHDCYVLVFDSIVNRKVFLPSYKSNLLHLMKKYVPVSILESFNNLEQDYIFEQVFEKFNKAGLISLDENEEKLIYKIDSQGILELVIDQVLRSKAKEIDRLNNVVKQKLASYRQANNQDQIDLVVTYLKKKGMIKQDNKAIYYSPFDSIKENSSKVSRGNNTNSKDSATTYQRAIAQLKSRPASTRPSKKSSLINYLKSHLRNEDPKTIDKLVKQMVNNKIIVISNTNKLIYKI